MRIDEGASPGPQEIDIFFAHYGRDGSAARRLYERLREYNLEVWEYGSAAQLAGVSSDVHGAIGRSRIAVFCISDEAIGRDWFKAEQSAVRQAIGPDGIFFVKVGALAPEQPFLAADLAEKSRTLIDLSDPANEHEYSRFLQSISHKLGASFPPITVAAALISLTEAEFHSLFVQCTQGGPRQKRWGELVEHCHRIGMGRHVEPKLSTDGAEQLAGVPELGEPASHHLETELAQRYGKTVEDFAPFDDHPLVTHVSEIIRMINIRCGSGRRIHLKWLHHQLTSANEDVRREAQAEWASTNTLAVIDSVAVFSEHLATCVDLILDTPGSSPTAVIWVPPDTRHLTRLARRSIANVTDRLAHWFRHLDLYPDRSLAFDLSDSASLRQRLHQLLSSFVLTPQAVNAARFARDIPHPPLHPRRFMGGR